MNEEVLISIQNKESRIAIVESGILQEVFLQRTQHQGLVGKIFKGRIHRVLPGIQAAFVDIGLEKTAYLHVNDTCNFKNTSELANDSKVSIEKIVSDNQEILVQVIRDPIGGKGAKLTTEICIPARYLVLMPNLDHIGISQRIVDEEQRNILLEIMNQIKGDNAKGYIIRTNAQGVALGLIKSDVEFLEKMYQHIREKAQHSPVGALIYEDLPLVKRIIRDLNVKNIKQIKIDNFQEHEKLCDFANEFIPGLSSKIEKYADDLHLFDLYAIEDQIQKVLNPYVKLKSGGSIVIEQTEAMTTIDVNTASFVGNKNCEETIFTTNLEATKEIAHQLKLRNIGGIIVIDFIDMQEDENKVKVHTSLIDFLKEDYAKTSCSEITALGLVEMTRKRSRESLLNIFCEPCGTCKGLGYVKSKDTICHEIFREVQRIVHNIAHNKDKKLCLIMAANCIIDMLLAEHAANISELENILHKKIKLQSEVEFTRDQYDVVMI